MNHPFAWWQIVVAAIVFLGTASILVWALRQRGP